MIRTPATAAATAAAAATGAETATVAPHLLQADELSFSYGGRVILDAVSMGVRSGELVGLVGPNGSGKTTLLRCLLGFLSPSGGRATLDGQEVSGFPRRVFARLVASLAQEMPTDIPLRAAELVLLGRVPHLPTRGLGFEPAAALARVARALEQCGVLELAERPLHQLSGGELRRVYLARALAQDASVLLLDEPIAGLDLRHQMAILDVMTREARAGVAVLAVLHDVNLAAEVCDRVVLLKAGRVLASGAPQAVLTAESLASVYEVDIRQIPDDRPGQDGGRRQFFVPSLPARESERR